MRKYSYLQTREPHNGRVMDSLSQTIPDEAMSIRTIMERHAKGLPIAGEKEAIYDEEENSIGLNPKTLDLVDLQELAMDNKADVNRLKSIIDEAKVKQKKTDFIENPINDNKD